METFAKILEYAVGVFVGVGAWEIALNVYIHTKAKRLRAKQVAKLEKFEQEHSAEIANFNKYLEKMLGPDELPQAQNNEKSE